MDRFKRTCDLCVVACLSILVLAQPLWATSDPCIAVRKDLALVKRQVAEYMQALQSFYDQKDFRLTEALNFKIKELRGRMEQLQAAAADCPADDSKTMPHGLSSTKTDSGKHAEKDCAELRKMVVPLVRKIHNLQRRERSLLTSFSPEEEAELQDASQELKTIQDLIKTKCAVQNARGSLIKRLRQ